MAVNSKGFSLWALSLLAIPGFAGEREELTS
jgi:hypothetical protein